MRSVPWHVADLTRFPAYSLASGFFVPAAARRFSLTRFLAGSH
jgi:hypothetical protein